MKNIAWSADVIAVASRGNPLMAIIISVCIYLAGNGLMALIEELITGERFSHWGDPVFAIAMMAYSGLCVYRCADWQVQNQKENQR